MCTGLGRCLVVVLDDARAGNAVIVTGTACESGRLTRRERLLWFVLPGLLVWGAGGLFQRYVKDRPPAPEPPAVPGHLPAAAYHVDLALSWGLVMSARRS